MRQLFHFPVYPVHSFVASRKEDSVRQQLQDRVAGALFRVCHACLSHTQSPHRHLEDAILARLKKNKNKKQIGHHARPMCSQQELSAVQRATARASMFNQGVGGTVSES